MAYTEFFVTKGASASDVNGGGPNLGTDDGPVDSEANCSSDVTGTVINNVDADGWTGSSIGDWLCFDTAGTKDYARITNIAGDVLTVTPAVTGSQAGKNVNVGGAWATVDHAASTITTAFVNAAGDFPRVNIKEGTYAESVVVDNAGTLLIPITYEGYKTSAGDNPPVANLPEIDADTTGATAFDSSARSYIIVRRLYCHTDAAALYGVNLGTYSLGDSCKAYSTGAAGMSFRLSGSRSSYVNCYSLDSAGVGFMMAVSYGMCIGCYAKSAGTYGFHLESVSGCIACIADTSAADGFYVRSNSVALYGCVGYGSTAGSGVRFTVFIASWQPCVMNCIFTENNQYGIEVDAADKYLLHEDYNAFYSNGVAARLNCLEDGDNDVTLTADPFVDAANGDFKLNTAAGAGLACKMTGFPGLMLDGTNRGFADIGALQML